MIVDIFFHMGSALKFIFTQGIEPKDEYFYEFTEEHYNELKAQTEDISETMYMFIPDSNKYQNSNEIQVASESEKNIIIKAAKIIERYCEKSNITFETYEDKLKYVVSMLPEVFSDGTIFSKYKNIEPINLHSDAENKIL